MNSELRLVVQVLDTMKLVTSPPGTSPAASKDDLPLPLAPIKDTSGASPTMRTRSAIAASGPWQNGASASRKPIAFLARSIG